MFNMGRYSIRKKLTWMNLLVSSATLVIASTAFAAYELAALRLAMVRDLSIQAQIAGANCASAIEFGDPDSATGTLSALNVAPNIVSAAIYLPSGEPFAAYSRQRGEIPKAPPLKPASGEVEAHQFTSGSLVLVRPIVFQGKTLGALYVRSDLREISDRLVRYAGIVAAVLLMSVPTALLFSAIFQGATAQPIMQLAGVARMVSRKKIYSVRAPASGSQDEIAILIEAFNEMLEQIQLRDSALQEAHERLNLALRNSGVGTWSWETDNTVVWDDFMFPLFGLVKQPATPDFETIIGIIDARDRDHFRNSLGEAVRTESAYDIDFRVIWPDGSTHSLSARGRIFRDRPGESVRLTGVCWDVSERRRAEEERQKFVSLVEQTDDFVGMFGLDGKVIFINRAGGRLVGLDGSGAIGKPFGGLFPETWQRRLESEILPSIIREEGNWVGEAQLSHSTSQQPIDVLMNVFPVNDPESGHLRCFAAIMRDITGRKQLEQQLLQSQKLESVGQLAGGVAHDFNNLLTIISGYSELILGRIDPNDPVCEPVEQISRAATRAAALTRQLLAFSSRQPTEQRDVDLNDVVTNVQKMLRRLIGEDVDLVLSLDSNAGIVRADPGQMEQIVVNLAINARDAMPGGGQLLIETAHLYIDEESAQDRFAVTPGHYVMLAVSDTGTGMTPEVRSRIFEPFFTTKERGKGTGLGLSTVYGIVQQSGGSITVQSEPGRGTTFRILLPTIQAAAGDTGQEEPEIAVTHRSGSETILLVEDEAGVRGYVRHILERNGYRVVEASNGLEAIETLHRLTVPIHLLLSDVVMPEMGGVELAGQFTTLHPGVPILFMSGYNDKLWMQQDLSVKHIQKPFASVLLLARIREVLDAKRARLPQGS